MTQILAIHAHPKGPLLQSLVEAALIEPPKLA